MKTYLTFVLTLTISFSMNAQKNSLPYKDILETSKEYTAGSVVSRMIDGLGFRYYWATEGLQEKDLNFQPSEGARTSVETLQHIYGLTTIILNSALKQSNTGQKAPKMTFSEMRGKTLRNLKKASNIFKKQDDLSEFTMVFKRGESETKFPFWNQINGPISDALWHVGQVVSFRRSSGNPLPKGVSVLSGVRRN